MAHRRVADRASGSSCASVQHSSLAKFVVAAVCDRIRFGGIDLRATACYASPVRRCDARLSIAPARPLRARPLVDSRSVSRHSTRRGATSLETFHSRSPTASRSRSDVYQPMRPGKFPIVVQVYGGAWQRGDTDVACELRQMAGVEWVRRFRDRLSARTQMEMAAPCPTTSIRRSLDRRAWRRVRR